MTVIEEVMPAGGGRPLMSWKGKKELYQRERVSPWRRGPDKTACSDRKRKEDFCHEQSLMEQGKVDKTRIMCTMYCSVVDT